MKGKNENVNLCVHCSKCCDLSMHEGIHIDWLLYSILKKSYKYKCIKSKQKNLFPFKSVQVCCQCKLNDKTLSKKATCGSCVINYSQMIM